MPSGVLSKILFHLSVDGPLALRHLLLVSKWFYYTVVNEDTLWTTISFDAEFFSHFRGRSVKQANSFAEQCLRRSNSRPLCIRIMCDGAFENELIAGPLQALRNPMYRGYQRCTSLIWYHDKWSAQKVRGIVAMLPEEFPSLQQLSLFCFRDPMGGSPFPNCPVIDRVEILGHNRPRPVFWGTNFAHVTTLCFGNSSIDGWANFRIAMVSLFPGLRDLTLFTDGTGAPKRLESQGPVEFQYLQFLRVRGCIPSEVLTCVVAPILEELHIKANTFHRTSIATLRYYSEPHCRHLHAHLPEAVSVEEPHWAEAFAVLVGEYTRLKTLHISKWMEEKCQKFIGHYDIVLY